MPQNKQPLPWERQPNETPKAFQAFIIYRDLGQKRNIHNVAKTMFTARTGREPPEACETRKEWKHGRLAMWSMDNDWPKRATAWDEYQDAAKREACTRDIEKMGRRHAKAARLVMARAIQKLRNMGDDEIAAIAPAVATAMLRDAVKIERDALGQADLTAPRNATITVNMLIQQILRDSLDGSILDRGAGQGDRPGIESLPSELPALPG